MHEVQAASITVDKSADEDVNGTCSLADAITAANTDTATNGCTAGSGADTITLGVNITLDDYLPDITSEITIEGANYDIDGNDEYQIFYVDEGVLTINSITLTGGDGGSYGGAIDTKGGSLTVTNSRLEDNEAGLLGGAIATDNTNVIIRNSIFVNNSSGSLGGALAFFSSVPSDRGWTDDMEIKTLLIDQTTFGEAVPAGCAAADISADPENHADASGGAMRISGGDVTIRRSSFIGNHAGVDGGAIYASAWRFLFENNTISCNRADADGGGMYVIVGDLILRHSTLYQNSAGDEGGGLYAVDDTGRNQDNEEGSGLYLQNSIIAGSTGGGDCVAKDTIDHNIGMYIGNGSCEPTCSSTDGPLNIGELQGEPAYHPLLDGSLAINRADLDVCSLSETSDTVESQQVQDFTDMNICEELDPEQDQIGTNRPMYGNCDIGSIESRTGVIFSDSDNPDNNQDPPATNTPVPPDTDTPVPPDTDTPVPPDTDTPVPPDTDTPVPPDTDTPVPPDTDTPVPPDTDTPVPPDTDTPVPPDTDTPVPPDTDTPVPPDTDTPVPPDTDTPVPPDTDTPVPQDPQDPDTLAETAIKKTEDAAATQTRAFELTETAIVLTQTAEKATYDAGLTQTQDAYATETEIAGLPPAEQTAIALTATGVAALTATQDADSAATMTPSPTASPDPETRCTHTVTAGETLFSLAQNYGTTVEQIRTLNQLTSNDLFVDQELIVPDCYDPADDAESSTLGYSCQQLFDSMVVRTTSRLVSCRPVDIELIDKHPALASGMIEAVNITGYVAPGVEVCFRNIGDLVFLDAATDPPTPYLLQSSHNAMGMTCGQVERIGTLVLVAAITEVDTYLELSTCQVTTTQTVRLRDNVGSISVLGLVPYNVTLVASARTNNWFNVSFLGTQGWISANYVRTAGICQ